jgi:SAM-dependent methyltransferase
VVGALRAADAPTHHAAPGHADSGPGCGTGFPLFELAYRCGPSCQLVGLDIWGAALARADQRRAYFGLDHVALARLEDDRFPFPDAHFDWVVSNLGINNFVRPRETLAECARVLAPGGRIAVTTNLKGTMAEFYAIFRAVLADTGQPAALERLAAHEDHRGTVESCRALLEGAGFEVVKAVEDQFVLPYVDGTALFHHPLIRYGFLPAWLEIADEKDRRAVFEELERRLNAHAAAGDGLRLTIPVLYLEARRSQGET